MADRNSLSRHAITVGARSGLYCRASEHIEKAFAASLAVWLPCAYSEDDSSSFYEHQRLLAGPRPWIDSTLAWP